MSDWATLKDLKERSANAYLLGTGPKKLWTKKHVAKTNNRHILWLFFRGNKKPLKFSKRSRFRNKLSNRQLSPPQSLPPNWHLSRWHRGESRLHFSAPHGPMVRWDQYDAIAPKNNQSHWIQEDSFTSLRVCFLVHPSKAIPSVPGAWFCCWLSIRRNSGSYR